MLKSNLLQTIIKDLGKFLLLFIIIGISILATISNSPKVIRYAFSIIFKYPIGLTQSVLYEAANEIYHKDRITYDFIIMGSSHMAAAFNVETFENYFLNTFNLSSDSQRPFDSYYLYKTLREDISCNNYILEASPSLFGSFSSEGLEKLLVAYPNIKRYGPEILFKSKDLHTLFVYLFQVVRIKPPDSYRTRSGTIYIKNGYFKYPIAQRHEPKPYGFSPDLNEIQIDFFSKLIEQMKLDDINVLVITPPLTPFDLSTNVQYMTFTEKINNICKIHNVTYIDFKYQTLLQDYFFDSHHLNSHGAEAFSEEIIDTLLNSDCNFLYSER